jgi:hypothetical protein
MFTPGILCDLLNISVIQIFRHFIVGRIKNLTTRRNFIFPCHIDMKQFQETAVTLLSV